MAETRTDGTTETWKAGQLYDCEQMGPEDILRISGILAKTLAHLEEPVGPYSGILYAPVMPRDIPARCAAYTPVVPGPDAPPIRVITPADNLDALMYQGPPSGMYLQTLRHKLYISKVRIDISPQDHRLIQVHAKNRDAVAVRGRILDVGQNGEDLSAVPLGNQGPVTEIITFIEFAGHMRHSGERILGLNIHRR